MKKLITSALTAIALTTSLVSPVSANNPTKIYKGYQKSWGNLYFDKTLDKAGNFYCYSSNKRYGRYIPADFGYEINVFNHEEYNNKRIKAVMHVRIPFFRINYQKDMNSLIKNKRGLRQRTFVLSPNIPVYVGFIGNIWGTAGRKQLFNQLKVVNSNNNQVKIQNYGEIQCPLNRDGDLTMDEAFVRSLMQNGRISPEAYNNYVKFGRSRNAKLKIPKVR